MRALTIALTLFFALVAPAASAACSNERVQLRGEWGSIRFRVAVADTVQERSRGLMHVPEMPRLAGMLFVYERPQAVNFWMENTLIPLDMLFADATGTITRIHENAIPLDRTPIPGGPDIQYVLEINGGLSSEFGITVGTQMRHPSIAQDMAAWPCEAD